MHPWLRTFRWLLLAMPLAGTPLHEASAHDEVQVPIERLSGQIASHPDSVELYLLRAELLRIGGELRAARADLDQVARRNPEHPDLGPCRAALALDAGEPVEARRLMDAVLARTPDAPRALRLRARAHVALGDRREAIADLDALARVLERPRPDLYLERARLQVASGDRAQALAGLDAARDRLGPVASLELYAIELELDAGRPVRARERLDRLRASYPDPTPLAGLSARIVAAGGGDAAAPHVSTAAATTAHPPEAGPRLSAWSVAALPRNSVWRYEATGTNLGTSWRTTLYADSAWPAGPGVLGFGESFIATTVPFGPDPQNRYRTTYFRTTFQVNDPVSSVKSLTLHANYDDGFVAYLNGMEIARRGLSGGVSYFSFGAPHEGGHYEVVAVNGGIPWLVQGTNVLAVEVHQETAGSDDLVWDAELVYADVPGLTRGPYLMVGTADAMTVRWRTNLASDSRVWFGTSPANLTASVTDPLVTTEHEVRLTGLQPDSRYYYAVGTSTTPIAGDASYTFVTAPFPGAPKPTRAWILGDSGNPTSFAFAVRDAYYAWTGSRGTDLWLMLGDNAYGSGTDEEYQVAVFQQYPLTLRQAPLWPTRGNHDHIHGGPNNDYYDVFTMPAAGEAGGIPSGTEAYYAFDWGNIHFVCMDSEGSSRAPGGPMLTWLANDLAANTRPWVIAYWHHPPYSKGSHDSDSESQLEEMRENVLPILEAGGVDLVLSGHSHSYERSYLLDGHYGHSSTLTAWMIVDHGDGRLDGDGPYTKPMAAATPNAGAVYAVSGSACQVSGGALNHPVMVTSLNLWGSMVLDVEGPRLDARFLSHTGAVLDSFAIVKSSAAGVDDPVRAAAVQLGPGLPNPFTLDLRMSYTLTRAGPVRLSILDPAGRQVAVVEQGWRAAGTHDARWDGRDQRGRRLPNGVYVAVLEAEGARVSRKVAFVR